MIFIAKYMIPVFMIGVVGYIGLTRYKDFSKWNKKIFLIVALCSLVLVSIVSILLSK